MWSEIATNGGAVGGVAAFGIIGHVVLDWVKERRMAADATRMGRTQANTVTVADAATTNAMMLESLRELREENKGLRSKVGRLQEDDRRKDKEIADMQKQLEETQKQLHAAQEQLTKITERLSEYMEQGKG